MKRSLLLTSIFTLLVAGIAAPAMAGTATSDLGVSATVTFTCTISTTPVDFGTYDPLASSILGATGIVSTTCTLGTPVQITLGQGLNPARNCQFNLKVPASDQPLVNLGQLQCIAS
ncbi:spore coat protein U domain-containing protein [Chroococcidiopsis sp. CCMEE 29]|uniref:spore coat protein U domain-containing protein n=1 Tax=Chroococcidiopsis sp. CCMEE 29 TaxID=155894 RepID=UPI0020222497|nr:spore coat protein U domain-containing protein [Chroococcidiopsis sp. CCMEE 29]